MVPFTARQVGPAMGYFRLHDTVDGRIPAPVDMDNILLFTGFYTFQVIQQYVLPSTEIYALIYFEFTFD